MCKTSNAPFNKQSKTSGLNKVEESRILLPMERWVLFERDNMSDLLPLAKNPNKLSYHNISAWDKDEDDAVETEGLVYTPIELFLKNFGSVVVDRVFVIVLASVSFLVGVLVGLWLF